MTNPTDDAHCVEELQPGSTGVWRITTAGSTHVLDLVNGTVTRFPGPGSAPTVNDCTRPIRTLDTCRVGERGRWTMYPEEPSDVDYYWHVTSVVRRIERMDAADMARS